MVTPFQTEDDVEFLPEPETRVGGNATRIGQTTFEGGSYKLLRPVNFNRIIIRLTAFTDPGTLAFLIYQRMKGQGGAPANRVATVTGFNPGGTGTFLLTPAEGLVTLVSGVFYILYGRDSASGSFTMRTYTVLALDLSNVNVQADSHVTNFSTTIAATATPATFDPRPVATGEATPEIADLSPIVRLLKV